VICACGELDLPVCESVSCSVRLRTILSVFAVGVSLFSISVSSPYFAHFVAHLVSPHVVKYLDLYLH